MGPNPESAAPPEVGSSRGGCDVVDLTVFSGMILYIFSPRFQGVRGCPIWMYIGSPELALHIIEPWQINLGKGALLTTAPNPEAR